MFSRLNYSTSKIILFTKYSTVVVVVVVVVAAFLRNDPQLLAYFLRVFVSVRAPVLSKKLKSVSVSVCQ